MKSYDVVAIAHNGEFVCENCLEGKAEKAVFYDLPLAQRYMAEDGYLNVVFAEDVTENDYCGRCLRPLL